MVMPQQWPHSICWRILVAKFGKMLVKIHTKTNEISVIWAFSTTAILWITQQIKMLLPHAEIRWGARAYWREARQWPKGVIWLAWRTITQFGHWFLVLGGCMSIVFQEYVGEFLFFTVKSLRKSLEWFNQNVRQPAGTSEGIFHGDRRQHQYLYPHISVLVQICNLNCQGGFKTSQLGIEWWQCIV